MKDDFITTLMKDVDDILESPIEMQEANQPILIFEGIFIIKDETGEIELDGKIQYNWSPNTGVDC